MFVAEVEGRSHMRLWVECATQALSADGVSVDGVSTLTTEIQFAAAVVSGQDAGAGEQGSGVRTRWAQRATESLVSGAAMNAVVDAVLAALPAGEHAAIALLHIRSDGRASLAEIDAPPLFMARRGELVLLPVTEEELSGRLVRRCDFTVQTGDHLAMVGEGYIRARGSARPWSWRDIAVSLRRLTATGCDAGQMRQALIRSYDRFVAEHSAYCVVRDVGDMTQAVDNVPRTTHHAIAVLAMFVRPMRTVTIWTGPPADRGRDREALERLLAEEGVRIVCGDTTAEIAARLLGGRLVMEPAPDEGWTEVPPTSRLVGAAERIDLITEGAVTLRVVRQRLAEVQRPRELAGREDGASRLAKLLLEADKVTLIVGGAINPAQTERDGTPLRKAAVAGLVEALEARGKVVAILLV
jgi:hypothetical protein